MTTQEQDDAARRAVAREALRRALSEARAKVTRRSFLQRIGVTK